MFKVIKGFKVGDSLIRDELGNLFSVFPDTFYERNIEMYFLLRKYLGTWKIVKAIRIDKLDYASINRHQA